MIKKNKIPTILAIVILIVGTFAGVFYLNSKQIFRIGASASNQPKDVRISNVSDNSATISWTTDSQTTDFLSWGETESSISKIEQETPDNQKLSTHSVALSGLKANTDYFFKINSEGVDFDNNGVAWKLTTGVALGVNPNSKIVSGSVINSSGEPVNRALVYITVNGYLASTISSNTGNFVYQLGNIRTPDFGSYAQIDPASTLLQVSVSAGTDGVASAQIFPQSAIPIPPIALGQVYDFRNQAPSTNAIAPNADLSLPEMATEASKFNVDVSSPAPGTKSVILESLKEGETVTSTQPEFFGKGPPGDTIVIEVHSENPITQSVTIPQDGSWSFSIPTGLAPGAHTITITWKDTTGITRSLTRNFVVQASELPAFVATPSQTLAPTASPTATPKATASPISTASALPEPVPVTGDFAPTLLLSIMGSLVILFAFTVWKMSEN